MNRPVEQPADLVGYLAVLLRRKWIVLFAVVLLPAASVYFSLQQTPQYRATSEVLLKYQNLAGTLSGIPDSSTVSQDARRVAETQARVARAPVIAERVLRKVGITDRSPDELLRASDVAVDSEADVLLFAVTDTDRVLAQRLASEYARQFVRRRLELDTQAVVLARRGIEERLEELGQEKRAETALYDRLVETQQQLQTMEILQTSNATVLRSAADAVQVTPRTMRNGLLGVFLGIVLGAGFAFLAHALDTRVRSPEEVATALGLPLLGRIPELGRRRKKQLGLAMLGEPDGIHAEAFRLLRTNIEFATVDRPAEVLLVTSATANEGKSTTAANLAVALARAGRRVALVEADLRSPSLDYLFQVPPEPGLTDVALGHVGLDDALVPVPLPGEDEQPIFEASGNGKTSGRGGLAVLLSGPLPPDPGEFAASAALERVLAELRRRFEIVVLDGTPLFGVGDALALSARVDGIVVVARVATLRRPMLRELQRVLSSSPARALGVVVTGTDVHAGYGYGYGYGRRSVRGVGRASTPSGERQRS